MIILKTVTSLQRYLQTNTIFIESSGFVPTMGALHRGHMALIAESKKEQPLTIASIFVNPTQFNEPADFAKYPVTIEKDIQLLEAAGCDVLFLPSVEQIYPDGLNTDRHYELGELENTLEGFYRPGHFHGVCQVVHRLLEIVKPAHLYLGSKDYPQCKVIQKMIELTGLKVQVHMVPTVREMDGLALSSRNLRLTEIERKQAVSIYRQLGMIKEEIKERPLQELLHAATQNLLRDGGRQVDYVAVADRETLRPVANFSPGEKLVALIAASMNEVRLIDNIEVNV
jgi:pantoate--beta-alanine ligase